MAIPVRMAAIQTDKPTHLQVVLVTQWVNPSGRGRARGPAGFVRAWFGVLTAPRQFFARAVAPGDQAPGLVFLAAVAGVAEASRYALVDGAAPVFGGRPLASAAFTLLLTVVLVAPAGLHLLAALQTVLLWPITAHRAGVSETVQVIAYATAPCVVAGLPFPAVRAACAVYGTALLVVGIATVHELDLAEGAIAAAIPAALLFGVAFRGFEAIGTLV